MYSSYPRRRPRILYHRLILLIFVPLFLAGMIIFFLVRGLYGGPDPVSSARVPSGVSSEGGASSAPASAPANSAPAESAPADLKGELSKWYLTLVNASNPLPENFTPAVTDINPAYCRDPNFRFDSRAVGSLNQMCAAAKQAGVPLLVISPYRSVQKQSQLFDDEVREVRARDKSLTAEEAKAKAAQSVLPPGTSEHNLGLALDFDSLSTSYENTGQFKWLSENAADFGFILRYPKNKIAVTGVSYEPWHYRYVGVYHARRIKAKGVCLEEYLDELRALPG